jgi:hypothetical protein
VSKGYSSEDAQERIQRAREERERELDEQRRARKQKPADEPR